MNKHLFRLLFGALFLVAATVFTGCKEDDSKSATPTLSVSTESLVFTDATEKTQTVDIKANCEWKVVASDLSWATVEPMNGRGNGTISVTVQELPAGTNSREGKISFTLIHAEFGNWGTAEQSIAVSQVAGSDVPTGEIAYANNFDKEAATKTYGSGNSWPYTDQFDGWKNESGYGIADVTYTTSGISVRNNSNSNSDYSDYAGSGVNNMFFGSNSNFTIEKIAVNSVNLRLTFGTERYIKDADNTFNHDEFKVQLSNDGTNWSAPLTYTFAKGVDPNGRWDLATADFTLPDGTTTLYIRFQATVASAYRLDDATLLEGAGGQAITFDYTEEPDPEPGDAVETTIPELIALCEAAGSEQQVIDESKDYYFEAVVVTDKEGGNTTSNNLQLMTEGATTAKNGITLYGSGVYTNPADEGFTFKAGDKVKVTLKAGEARVTTYNKLYEVTGSQGASWVVVEKIGTATVTPVEIAPDQITDFQAMPVSIKNVTAPATASTWNGTKTFTQNGVEVTVYTSQGAPWADQQFVAGATGTITGYAALYKGAAQVSPRSTKDIADFMSGTTPEPDPDVTPIGEITTAGTYKTEGTVVARGKMAYIIADNTGAMMVYHNGNERSVGEKISISGEVTLYNAQSTPLFSASAEVEVLSTGNSWSYNPAQKDGAAMDALLSGTPVCTEIAFQGNLAVSGNYVNVTIPGASTAIGSIKYIDNSTVAAYDGRDVLVKGYFVGTSSGKYVNVLPYSVEETNPSTDPQMTVDPASLSFAAAGGEKSVTVTTRNADGCTIEASVDNAVFSVSVSGTTVTVVAKENTSESAINATLTVKLIKSGSAVVTKTVALSQSGKSSSTGDGTTITMTYTDIINGGSDIPTNAYGTQNVNDESTYYKWTFSSLDFAGARVCIASSSDYKGLIQMQGNDSDVAKQGFFGNVTDLGKITKIVVVSVNTRYEPSVNLYLGTDKYPTTNVQAHPSYVKEGNVYTEEYEISGDYGYFRLWNDSVGATYIQSISITYSK